MPSFSFRPDGTCEVDAAMVCVWMEAWAGSRRMRHGDIASVKPPLDHRRIGHSAWLGLLDKPGGVEGEGK